MELQINFKANSLGDLFKQMQEFMEGTVIHPYEPPAPKPVEVVEEKAEPVAAVEEKPEFKAGDVVTYETYLKIYPDYPEKEKRQVIMTAASQMLNPDNPDHEENLIKIKEFMDAHGGGRVSALDDSHYDAAVQFFKPEGWIV